MSGDDLPTERFRLLLEQLREEIGSRYGWQSSTARLLGIHPSYVSRLALGTAATVGREAIRRARAALGLSEAFFFDRALGSTPHYRDHCSPLRVAPQADRPSVVYSDDLDIVGGLFLTGELPVCSSLDEIRELVLLWRGVQAELRPRERDRLDVHLGEAIGHLVKAKQALEAFDNAADELADERRALEGDADG